MGCSPRTNSLRRLLNQSTVAVRDTVFDLGEEADSRHSRLCKEPREVSCHFELRPALVPPCALASGRGSQRVNLRFWERRDYGHEAGLRLRSVPLVERPGLVSSNDGVLRTPVTT